jgi:predicted transcriptional regulator YdeE
LSITSQKKETFTLIGISARTTNAKEMTDEGIIGKQWQRVMAEHLIEQIPNRADNNIIAMYTDYESDANGEYSFIIGAKVTSGASVPDGMVVKQIESARYAVFTSEKGPAWEVVPNMWKKIWATPSSEMGGARAYLADFEIYDERAKNPADAEVEVWVGMK